MKKIATFLFITIALSSCLNNPNTEYDNALSRNETEIQSYILNQKLTTQKTASGLYYQITKANSAGEKSAVGNTVTFHYKLFLVQNGAIIDTSSRANNKPSSVVFGANLSIYGVEEALSILKAGEKGVFLMNNDLAFGNTSTTKIPAYSAIGVEIEVLKTRTEEQQIDDYVVDNKLTLTEKTVSGLRFVRTAITAGNVVSSGQMVTVKYTGKFLNGNTFDSGQINVTVGAGGVIKGFDEGVGKLRIGEKATLIFPSSIGYGTKGSGAIMPYSPLIFEIEIVK